MKAQICDSVARRTSVAHSLALPARAYAANCNRTLVALAPFGGTTCVSGRVAPALRQSAFRSVIVKVAKATANGAEPPTSDYKAKAGDVVTGVVLSVVPLGAIIDLGDGVRGTIRKMAVSKEPVTEVSSVFKEGATVKALFLGLNRRGGPKLSTKELELTPGDMLRDPQLVYDKAEETGAQLRLGRDTSFKAWLESSGAKAGDVVEGTVLQFTRYGAFIDLGGAKGLLHRTQFHRKGPMDKVLAKGGSIKVKILSLDPADGRVRLSTLALE